MKLNDIIATVVYYIIKGVTFLTIYLLLYISTRIMYENYLHYTNFDKSMYPLIMFAITVLIFFSDWTKDNVWAKIQKWLERKL